MLLYYILLRRILKGEKEDNGRKLEYHIYLKINYENDIYKLINRN